MSHTYSSCDTLVMEVNPMTSIDVHVDETTTVAVNFVQNGIRVEDNDTRITLFLGHTANEIIDEADRIIEQLQLLKVQARQQERSR